MTDSTLAVRIARVLYEMRAMDVIALSVHHLTIITDYMVIASARTTLAVRALSDEVDERMAAEGARLLRKEGHNEGRWIVLDYGDVLVHIFHQEEREYYNLERLWDDGQNRVDIGVTGEADFQGAGF